jgi:hypothetical protein
VSLSDYNRSLFVNISNLSNFHIVFHFSVLQAMAFLFVQGLYIPIELYRVIQQRLKLTVSITIHCFRFAQQTGKSSGVLKYGTT